MLNRACLAVVTSLVAMPAFAAAPSVTRAWSRATAVASQAGAIFATIQGGSEADRLVGVDTPIAQRAMLHTMDMSGNMMRMRQVASLPVPPNGTLALGPDGDHVMLTGLEHALRQGEEFPATFHFAHAQAVTVTVKVEGPGASTSP